MRIMIDFELKFHHYSERTILVQWPSEISENILNDIIIFKNHLKNLNIKSVLQIDSSYNSILITYISTIDKFYDAKNTLIDHYLSRRSQNQEPFRHWKIPVCYDDNFGLDLDEISRSSGLTKVQIIELHSSPIYTIFFIGFLPGFLYLGGLDKRLHFPRKKTPRTSIEKGSVGIGDQQTGIYPDSSPAGWQIIGNSPLNFFEPSLKEPCFARSGDTLQFIPIHASDHADIKKRLDHGAYQPESEVRYA